MVRMLWVVAVLGLVGCGGAGPVDIDAGTMAAPDAGGGAADCTLEVAPGYPHLGARCGSHVVFKVNGFAYDETTQAGLAERGYGLGALRTEKFGLTLPVAAGAYSAADCIPSGVTFGSNGFDASLAYNASMKRLSVTMHRAADAAWGDFEGDYCRVRGYINVGGSVTPNFDCKRVSGKFAARVEAPRCQSGCSGDVTVSGNSCVLPGCAPGGTCAPAYCPIGSPTCAAALPVPDGTYATTEQVGSFPLVSLTFAKGKLAAMRVERQPPFAVVERHEVAFTPPKELPRAQGGYVISENVRPDGGLLRMNVLEQRASDGGVALEARSPWYVEGSTSEHLDDFVMRKQR